MLNMVEFAGRICYGKGVRKLTCPDIIVGSTIPLFAAFGAHRMARRMGVPFILEVADVWPQTLIDAGMSRWNPGVMMFKMIERYVYRNADAIITLLPGAIDHMRVNGAKADEIIWLPNGIDFNVAPAPVRPAISLPFKVMFAGTHSAMSSPDILLNAAAILQERGRHDIEVSFVGDGPMKSELKQMSKERHLANTRFRDPVPKRDIYSVLSEADVLVALWKGPILFRFGMSINKLYDYMAAARPVLFAARSMNDPVSDSECGLTVPPENPKALADAIITLADMPTEERWQMGLRGRRYVEEHHDVAMLSEQLEGLLVRTLKSYQASGRQTTSEAQ
jgi:glycosyltransferase involved in cell wall biosynthesis